MIKPGVKTTEFVTVVLTLLSTVLTAVFHRQIDLSGYVVVVAMIVTLLAVVAYIAGRVMLKLKIGGGQTLVSIAGTVDPDAPAQITQVVGPAAAVDLHQVDAAEYAKFVEWKATQPAAGP